MKKHAFLLAAMTILVFRLAAQDTGQVVTVPIVFHVFYSNDTNDASYITWAQIRSQMIALNNDFTAQNTDFANMKVYDSTYGTNFDSVAAQPADSGTRIVFRQIKSNGYGKYVGGVVYKLVSPNWTIKWNDNTTWETISQPFPGCINVYVAQNIFASGKYVRGLTFPSGHCVALKSNCFGTLDAGSVDNNNDPMIKPGFSLDPQYKEGGILTHEIGHVLGLSHPFLANEFPAAYYDPASGFPQDDTPESCNSCVDGCNSVYQYLGNGHHLMHMNYMDYADDPCIWMFTKAQAHLMRSKVFEYGLDIITMYYEPGCLYSDIHEPNNSATFANPVSFPGMAPIEAERLALVCQSDDLDYYSFSTIGQTEHIVTASFTFAPPNTEGLLIRRPDTCFKCAPLDTVGRFVADTPLVYNPCKGKKYDYYVIVRQKLKTRSLLPNDLYFLKIALDTGFVIQKCRLAPHRTTAPSSVIITPNPSTGLVNISSEAAIGEVQLFDSQLRLVSKTDRSSMDVSNLAPGMYIVKIQFADGTSISEKLIRN